MASRLSSLLCAAACTGRFVSTSATTVEVHEANGMCLATESGEANSADDACLFQHRTNVGSGGKNLRADEAADCGPWPCRHRRKLPDGHVRSGLPAELVSAVYTFGGPATKQHAFRNAARENGCFGGLRIYNEDPVCQGYKRVDAASMINQYSHAYISSLALHWQMDSYYTVCDSTSDGNPSWPRRIGGIADAWDLHVQTNYVDRLSSVTVNGVSVTSEEPFETALLFTTLARKSYDTTQHAKEEIAEKMPGWTLVGKTVYKQGTDTDPIMIAQESATLDCAVVFTGTNDDSELATSIYLHHANYCGFEGVHAGYRNELWTLGNHTWQPLVPLLERCNRVFCVGHSLGGAVCEIFAACLNSGNVTDPDYKQLVWTPKTPALLPEYNGDE